MLSSSSRRWIGRLAQQRISRSSNNTTRRYMAEMPVPQSSQAVLFEGHPKNEGWESTIAWWYSSSFILICLVLGAKPETNIRVWAQQEARARMKLQEEGQTEFEFGKHYQDVVSKQAKDSWDKFSFKTALRMTEDDDDDEDEDADDEDEEDEDDE